MTTDAEWDAFEAALPEDDAEHPYNVLGRWEMMIREEYGPPTDLRVTVSRAVDYLDGQLDRMAQDPEQDFPLFAREVAACLAKVESGLAVLVRPERGAPCPECPLPAPRLILERNDSDTSGASDVWRCPDDRTHAYFEADYRKRVTDDYLGNATSLTAPDMATKYNVAAGSVRGWAAKTAEDGEPMVRKRGRDHSGRQMYDVADVNAVRHGERKEQKVSA